VTKFLTNSEEEQKGGMERRRKQVRVCEVGRKGIK
jgi:hypothetical protein